MATINGTYTDSVTLSANPTTLASTATISGSASYVDGVYAPAGTAWTLVNQGLINETGTNSYGIGFAGNGTIINSGTVAGARNGILLAGGGAVTNQSGGTITGYYGITAVDIPATVVNAGIIAGDDTTGNADGVYLHAGGSITNQASGTISGRNNGIRISGDGGTVDNLGRIQSNDIPGTGSGAGVYLADGGLVTNGAAGGTVSAAYILGYNSGVQFGSAGAGTLVNYGTVNGNPGSPAVLMATGTIINGPNGATGALIEGGDQTSGVLIAGPGMVVNFGTIIGFENNGDSNVYYGISLGGAGSIGNLGANALIANYVAVYATTNDTVTNAGTIASIYGGNAGQAAVVFGGGTNRLIVDPGAVFVGTVSGSGPVTLSPNGNSRVIGTANGIGSTTLELASAAAAGTLSGLGTSIVNFSSLVFDTGARWTVQGNAAAGGLGTLGISGFAIGDTIDLTGFQAVSRTFAGNSLVLTDAGGAHATLAVQGSFATNNMRITNDGSGGTDISLQLAYAQTIDEVGIVATSETVAGGVMTLLNGASPVGTLAVGGLGTGDFSLQPDGAAGTDVVVHTAGGIYASGITLSVNPTTIASTATISDTATSGIGIKGPAGTAWTVTNQGTVSETGLGSIGISLAAAGTLTNATGGRISGAQDGVSLTGGGLVSAQAGGTIAGIIGIAASGATTVVNAGSIAGNVTAGSGISLTAGGTVTNTAGGTISGSYGIGAASVAATIVNAGSIGDGTALPTGAAIALKKGGLIVNQSGGRIIAGLQGIYIGGAAGTIINAGSIAGGPTSGNGIIFATGGVVTNQSGGVITGKYGVRAVSAAISVVNYGSIGGNLTAAGAGGINLAVGGSVTNQSGGTITGLKGVVITGGSVVNAGIIGGNATTSTGVGVQLTSGGPITNQSGGTITGFAGVYAKTTATTVVNAGSIGGNTVSGSGVRLAAGGSLTNQSGGVITGFDGILAAGATTVVNAGSIGGTTAVAFGAGAANRLVIDPGAAFTGLVDGGNTIGAAFVSTLELASGAAAGTLSGLGSQFVHFASTTIDANANWTLSGTNSLAAGATLTNSGTLTDSGTLLNSGTVTGNPLQMSGGVLTNQASGVLTATYIYGIAAGGPDIVVNQGTISSTTGAAIYLNTAGTIANAAGGAITGYNAGVRLTGDVATVSNLGQIAATAGIGSDGAYLGDGGLVINGQPGTGTSTASIQGYYGVAFRNAVATLGNYGTIIGEGARGVDLGIIGGSMVNGAGGATAALIEASAYGVYAGAGLVINQGTIIATGTNSQTYGVAVHTAGVVNNLGTAALIEGYGGVRIGIDGTLENAGTIASNQGAAGIAVDFVSGNVRLIDDPGAVFVGQVLGSTDGTAVLELASAAAAGTIDGLGTAVRNFTSLVFDSGAQWTVSGDDSDGGLGTLAISGFTAGDTIDLTGFAATGETFSGNALVLTDGGGHYATLAIQGDFASANFVLAADGDGGTDITVRTVVPPEIAGTSPGQAVDDDATIQPFAGVTISDANSGGPLETVTITVTSDGSPSDAGGILSGSGLTKIGAGTYTLAAASAAAATTALEALVFTPTAHQVAPGDTVTTGFTLAVTDTLDQSTTDSATSVVTTALNDPPSVTGTQAGQLVDDNSALRPFAGVTVTDPDPGASETVTIVLTDGGAPTDADGRLAGSGLTKTGTGTYTLAAGTPGAVTAELEALIFIPTHGEVAVGDTITTGMTLSVTDGIVGSPVTDTTTSVVTTAVIPCFAAGTRIATARGAVPVERLREGDMLLTIAGKHRPIQWIGKRTIDCNRHIAPDRVKPIRIAPHAFGENRPGRALLLSPDHSVFVEDVLIPVKHLVNGTTVTQIDVRTVTYYHVELPSHDVVLAEGLPAETYLETGGRFAFENGGGAMQLHPDFAPDEARVGMVWQNFGYAPLIGTDGQLDRVRARLACQALMLGDKASGTPHPGKRARKAATR